MPSNREPTGYWYSVTCETGKWPKLKRLSRFCSLSCHLRTKSCASGSFNKSVDNSEGGCHYSGHEESSEPVDYPRQKNARWEGEHPRQENLSDRLSLDARPVRHHRPGHAAVEDVRGAHWQASGRGNQNR